MPRIHRVVAASMASTVVAISSLFSSAPAMAGGASGSCNTWRGGVDVVTASCRTVAGRWLTSSVNLNHCVGINPKTGSLTYQPNGNFRPQVLSSNFEWHDFSKVGRQPALRASVAASNKPGQVTSFMNLNQILTNRNGVLRCEAP